MEWEAAKHWILQKEPDQYLQAGMGDTIGKYFECHFVVRVDQLTYSSALGREISNMCYAPLLEYGEQALADSVDRTLCEPGAVKSGKQRKCGNYLDKAPQIG